MTDNIWSTETLTVGYKSIFLRVACSSIGVGQPLLFLHGWNHSSRVWRPVVERIDAGHRCIAIDLPGFGYSEPMPRSMVSIESYARVCTVVLEQQAQSATPMGIIGDSFGALVGLAMMNSADVYGRFLLLSGCPSEGLHPILRAVSKLSIVSTGFKALEKLPPSIAHKVLKYFALGTVRRLHDVSNELIDAILQADPIVSQAVFGAMAQLDVASLIRPAGVGRVLVARGQYDKVVSRGTAVRLARRMEAEYVEIPGVGHTPMLEDPEYCAGIIGRLLRESES